MNKVPYKTKMLRKIIQTFKNINYKICRTITHRGRKRYVLRYRDTGIERLLNNKYGANF